MRGLPLDRRGYPVPWFAAWEDGEGNEVARGRGIPQIKFMSGKAVGEALRDGRCWVCGGRLGRYKAFVIGPMCAVNRINAEPPSHLDCADFSARACPFLARPHMRRSGAGDEEVIEELPGIALLRNPKVACVWIIQGRFTTTRTEKGPLMRLPEPDSLRWYAEGRPATRPEIEEAVTTGLPSLHDLAKSEREHAEIDRLRDGLFERVKRELV